MLQSPHHLVALCWTLSSSSSSFLNWGAQNWTQHCRWGLTRAEQRGRRTSLERTCTGLFFDSSLWPPGHQLPSCQWKLDSNLKKKSTCNVFFLLRCMEPCPGLLGQPCNPQSSGVFVLYPLVLNADGFLFGETLPYWNQAPGWQKWGAFQTDL